MKTYKTSICKSHYSYLNNCEKFIISIVCSNEVKLLKSVFDGKPFHTLITRFAGSNLAPRSTQLSIPPGSVNEYQLRLGRQRQLIPIADERVGVQVKLKSLENTCHT